jgi:hypothetical protein
MAKLALLLALSTFLISCQQNPDCANPVSSVQKAESNPATCPTPTPEPDPDPTPDPEPTPDPDVPSEALIFDANIQFHNFNAEQEAKVLKAIEIIKKVVASSEFRNKILNFTYNGKKQFVDNKGMTNEQVYQALLDGREDLIPEVDHQMDLELELYYSWTSTVGYTTPDVLLIHMNTKFFNPYTPSEVAGNVFHEWTHKLGFDHASSYSVSRDSSVPYAIGYLIEELGKKYE